MQGFLDIYFSILLIHSSLNIILCAYRLSRFLYLILFRQIQLMMADSVLYGILHCLLWGSKNGNSKVCLLYTSKAICQVVLQQDYVSADETYHKVLLALSLIHIWFLERIAKDDAKLSVTNFRMSVPLMDCLLYTSAISVTIRSSTCFMVSSNRSSAV